MTPLALAVLLALAGTIAGSFVALVAHRLPRGEPVVVARSRCDGCGRRLTPVELVPLLGYLARRGRCGTCAAPIPWRYPAIEAGAAAIGVVAALASPNAATALVAALLGWWLLLLALLDGEYFWLPSALTLPLIAAGLAATAWLDPAALAGHVIGAAGGFLSLAAIARLYRRVRGRTGLGGGDAKLFAASGAWLGWHALPLVLALAAVAGLVVALVVWRDRLAATTRLPFGVFLAGATWGMYVVSRWTLPNF